MVVVEVDVAVAGVAAVLHTEDELAAPGLQLDWTVTAGLVQQTQLPSLECSRPGQAVVEKDSEAELAVVLAAGLTVALAVALAVEGQLVLGVDVETHRAIPNETVTETPIVLAAA